MDLRVGGKYKLSRKLGSGAFGDIYHGILIIRCQHQNKRRSCNQTCNNPDQEPIKSKHPQLLYETKLYKLLQGGGTLLISWNT